jgi:ABC-2 type transport system permease protein
MMRNHALRDVIDFELRRTLTKRSFWLATLLVPGLLVAILAVSVLSGASSEDAADAQSDSELSFEYIDASGLIDPELAIDAGGTLVDSVDEGIARVKAGDVEAFFAYPTDPTTETIAVYGINDGLFGNSKYASKATSLLEASVSASICSPQYAAIIQGGTTSETTTFDGDRIAGGIESVIPPMLYVVLLYIVIILMGNQMLAATVEEKENRVTEMILTTIRAKTLLVGKVISLFAIGFVQTVAFGVPVAIGYLFFRDKLSFPEVDLSALQFEAGPMIIGALLLVGSFALFTSTLVAVGAAMPTVKDASPYFAGMVITLFLPIYVISLIITSPQAPIVQAFTFFPYTAPVTALVRNAFGSLPVWIAVVDIVVLFALSAVALQIAVGIFKYGSIEYAKKVSLKAAFAKRASS